MPKLILKLILLLSLIAALVYLGISSGVINITSTKDYSSNGKLLSQIEDIGNVQLTYFQINIVIEDTLMDKTFTSKDDFPKGRILVIVNGEESACINLKAIKEEDIKSVKDTIFITLPMPSLCNTKINYDQSKIYDSSFNSHALDQYKLKKILPNAENNIKAEAIRMGILDKAKENAMKILPSILQKESKNIVFLFEE
jgi:Protein of unknown function (DUF4230)